MNSSLVNLFKSLGEVNKLISEIRKSDVSRFNISELHGSSKSLLIKILSESQNQIAVFLPSVKSLKETKVELEILGLEDLTVAIDDFSKEAIQEKLTAINKKDNLILISTYEMIKKRLPSKEQIDNNTTILQVGADITYEDLIEYLGLLNYQRDKFVGNPGEFSVRGSIIDFWSYSEKQPCRIEYDGDFLESIRYFDVESQRSSGREESVSLASSIESGKIEYTSNIFDYLDNPLVFVSAMEIEKIINTDYVEDEVEIFSENMDDDLKDELLNGKDQDEAAAVADKKINDENLLFSSSDDIYNKNARWIIENEIFKSDSNFKLNLLEAPLINSNFDLLFNILKQYSGKHYQIYITAENELQAERLLELLSDLNEELRNMLEAGKVKIFVLTIGKGFISSTGKLLILTDYQIFNKPYRTKISAKQKYKKSRVKDFAKIKRGDFVVHEYFGIGQYQGLETIKIGSIEQESIKILYAEGGIVYVNLNYLGLVKKFSSKENASPRLSTLGGNEWKSTKKKVKNKIKEAARDLITLYAKRKASKGTAYSPDSIWQKELEASFFYEDTLDQTKVMDEVKDDMESENPMDRLVCGDVGFGKTEIAVRAAFKAINDGKQVCMLVPTTILAEQHFNTFNDRLSQFPVKVTSLSRFQSKTNQTKIINDMTNGKVDVVIGTHRLLSKDVKFKDLGLLIIDEEQRFGVMAKEKLRKIKLNVDTLALTATPIPRTLNLSLLGARDLSIIATPPPNRQPIITKVEMFEISKIREWILNEVKRNGQVYFVHDRVQSIDKIASYVQKHIPEVNIAIAHGQMKPSQLENVIHDFLNKKYHVLISTKIIESGLDIPNVNTIIINRADRFGLAELHQLRGRVGRSDKQAFAYLIVPSMNTITKKAVRRLQAIEEYTDLGEGFNISMRDLEIRGAGNLLGTEQSGAIDSVGFDLYIKLLDEAVEELKHAEFQDVFKELPKISERSEPVIDTYFEIGIPKSFMPDQSDRLSFYSALFSIIKLEEINEIKDELEDRFGKIPPVIERLISVAVLRYFASLALFEKISIQRDKVSIVLPKIGNEDFYKESFTTVMQFVVDKYSSRMKLKQGKKSIKLEMINDYASTERVIEFLTNFCREIIELNANK